MDSIINIIIQNAQQTTIIEVIAVVFGLLSVIYARKENILVFPTGIISVIIYVYICQKFGLYADMGINAFYLIMSVYGWYNWTHQKGKAETRAISRTTKNEKIYLSILGVVFFVIIRYILINYTDSTVPNIDSITTSIFLIGMWLMSLKKIENWTLWIIGDAISIPLYAYKGLALTSVQYSIFLVIAVMGYISWKQNIDNNTN
ncbi:MAG: nicotinamide mononucleotide transporter [Bacteroidetes bacterium 4572_112]|nr:MAG: nicotinamide mononucleotide transporter [Bacteroidetes bacterium 4572_112]